jgi:hypothetical protein
MKTIEVLLKVLKQIHKELQSNAQPGQYTRRIFETSQHSIHAGLTEPEKLPLVAFEFQISSIKKVKLERQTVGLVCEVKRSTIHGRPCCRIEIQTTSSAFSSLFTELASDLIDTVLKSPQEKAAAADLSRRLDLWQRFLESGSSEGLSPQQVVGLFGELTLMELALGAGCDPVSVVSSWTGPFGSNQDFMMGATAVEVKTTCGNDATCIQISNLRQLDTTGLTSLYLFHAAFDQREGAGRSLPDLVNQLTEKLAKVSPAAEFVLSTALVAGSYLHAHAGRYQNMGFTKRFFKFYEVTDNFPRLTESSVPDGVIAAGYTLDLALANCWARDINSISNLYPNSHV